MFRRVDVIKPIPIPLRSSRKVVDRYPLSPKSFPNKRLAKEGALLQKKCRVQVYPNLMSGWWMFLRQNRVCFSIS